MGVDHGLTFADGVDHGLFAINVLACAERFHGDLAVPVVGRGNDDSVYIFARDDFTIVAGDEGVRAIGLFHALEAAVVAVAGGYEFNSREGGSESGVALAHAAGADKRDLDIG